MALRAGGVASRDRGARPVWIVGAPGLATREDIITLDEEATLIAHIDGEGLSPCRLQGGLGKRLICSSSWTYHFDTGRFAPTVAIPDWLQPLKDRAAEFAGLASDEIVQALLIRYDKGAGIGWHTDRPVFVIGVSVGHPATVRFRRRAGTKFEHASAPIHPRAIYHLSGEACHDAQHPRMDAQHRGNDGTRWTITFRTLRINAERRFPRVHSDLPD